MKMNIKLLRKNSLQLEDGMSVFYPQYNDSEELDISQTRSKFNGCYAVNNSTICFVLDGEVYAAPYTRGIMSIIKEIGLKQKAFFVPFSNWDYPAEKADEWHRLCENARRKNRQDFVDDCIRLSREEGLQDISPKALSNCMMIPDDGIELYHPVHHYKSLAFPVIRTQGVDCTTRENLGTYCTNNGVVVFVYLDGNTYLTRGYKITSLLDEAGFKRVDMFVPLSNGEEIDEPAIHMRWANIKKNDF